MIYIWFCTFYNTTISKHWYMYYVNSYYLIIINKKLIESRKHTLNLQPESLKMQGIIIPEHFSFKCVSSSSLGMDGVPQRFGHCTENLPHFPWCVARVSATNSFLHDRQGTSLLGHSVLIWILKIEKEHMSRNVHTHLF